MSVHNAEWLGSALPWKFVSALVEQHHLNEAEAGDLSALAEALWETKGLRGKSFEEHLQMRAEVLAKVGTEVQELYDLFEEGEN